MDREVFALLEQSKGIVAGISGGRDSMALLHLLKPFYPKLTVAHVNYQTRENSYKEETLVQECCAGLDIRCTVLRAEGCALDMPNFEAHARKVRYDFYKILAAKYEADIIVTAQHQSDLAETVLLRLLRGSSRLYMKKIRPLADNLLLVRPLLGWSRSEVTAYCTKHFLVWREDESNESTYFLRNFLRKEILPPLEAKVPYLESRLSLLSKLCEEEEDFLQAQALTAKNLLGKNPPAEAFLKLHPALQRRILALWCGEQGLPAPGAKESGEIIRKLKEAGGGIILYQKYGQELTLKKGCLLWRREGT